MVKTDLKPLEGKKLNELAPCELQSLLDAYLAYFDRQKPRKRAIGYAVILGGVPTSKIGMVDVTFHRVFNGGVAYSLSMGPVPLCDDDPRLHDVIQAYIQDDERLSPYAGGDFSLDADGRGPTLPLFAPTRNSSNERLANCVTIMTNAGNAIGFNAMSLRLHELHGSFFIPTALHYDQGEGLAIKDRVKIGAFVSRVKKR